MNVNPMDGVDPVPKCSQASDDDEGEKTESKPDSDPDDGDEQNDETTESPDNGQDQSQTPNQNNLPNNSSIITTQDDMITHMAKRKCYNFLTFLLDRSARENQTVARNMKMLVQELIDGDVSAEDFPERIPQEMNSSPQPALPGFLKKSLPPLRQALASKDLVIDGIRPPLATTPLNTLPKTIVTATGVPQESQNGKPPLTSSSVVLAHRAQGQSTEYVFSEQSSTKAAPTPITLPLPQVTSCSVKIQPYMEASTIKQLNLPQIHPRVPTPAKVLIQLPSRQIEERRALSFKREAELAKLRTAVITPILKPSIASPLSASATQPGNKYTSSLSAPSIGCTTAAKSTMNSSTLNSASSTTSVSQFKTPQPVQNLQHAQQSLSSSPSFFSSFKNAVSQMMGSNTAVPGPSTQVSSTTPAANNNSSPTTSIRCYTNTGIVKVVGGTSINTGNNNSATISFVGPSSDPRLQALGRSSSNAANAAPAPGGGGMPSSSTGTTTITLTPANVHNPAVLSKIYKHIQQTQRTDPARAQQLLTMLAALRTNNAVFKFTPPPVQGFTTATSSPFSSIREGQSNLPPTLNHNTRVLINAEPPLPPNWECNYTQALKVVSPYLRLPIPESSKEYHILSGLFVPSIDCTIKASHRIINTELWKRFITLRKEHIANKSNDWSLLAQLGLSAEDIERKKFIHENFERNPELNEIPYLDNIALLWHGSRQPGNIDTVLSQGLDERLSNSGLLGRGIYFSDNPYKAMDYDRNGTLLLFAVFLGDCLSVDHLPNKTSIVREPEKAPKEKRNHLDLFYDSIVGRPNPKSPANEYVIYNRAQCVPLYAIEYVKNRNITELDGGKLFDIYYGSRKYLPAFAWMPFLSRSTYKYHVQQHYQFYAKTIFDLMDEEIISNNNNIIMEEAQPKASCSRAIGFGSMSIDNINKAQDEELERKLNSLSELGFTNRKKNKELLLKFGYDADATAAYLLDHDTDNTEASNSNSNSQSVNVTTTTTTHTNSTNSTIVSSTSTSSNVMASAGGSSQNFPISAPTSSLSHLSLGPQTVVVSSSSSSSSNNQSPPKRSKIDPDLVVPVTVASIKDMLIKSANEYESLNKISTTGSGSAETSGSQTTVAPTATHALAFKDEDEECQICTVEYPKDFVNWKDLTCCKNKICTTCFSKIQVTATSMSGQICTFSKCPFCSTTNGMEIGNCPNGSMTVKYLRGPPAVGYEQYGTIQIQYIVPGSNGAGGSSSSTKNLKVNRVAFLPQTKEGEQVLQLLRTAWNRRLIFTIGTSNTTGVENTLVWNIHHKTSLHGGVARYGYPDPTYLTRVRQELAQYNII